MVIRYGEDLFRLLKAHSLGVFPVKAQSQLQLIEQDLPHPLPDDFQLPPPLHDVLGDIIVELQPLRRRGAVKLLKRII
eukprot:6645472-Pyramimonas_sp.AAC.1